MLVSRAYLRELHAHLVNGPSPQVAGVNQDVVLVHKGQVLALACLCAGEGIADNALHAIAGVDADLGRDLGWRTDAHRATVANVRPFGALTHDDKVDATARDPLQRQGAHDPRVEPHRAQVYVLVEGEPQLEQEAAFEDTAGNPRIPHRAEQNRVMATDLGQD